MLGIILAGGVGTRLYPSTTSCVKQLLPLYDKPMIYYPLSEMLKLGITDIVVISQSDNMPTLRKLIGPDGSENLGARIRYLVQEEPKGIAEALMIVKNAGYHRADDNTLRPACLMLGDNVFHGASDAFTRMRKYISASWVSCYIPLYQCSDTRRYGTAEINNDLSDLSKEALDMIPVKRIIEKPKQKIVNGYAVPGVYFYTPTVYEKIENLKPSERGELEITDLNNMYAAEGNLFGSVLPDNCAWFDAGTPASLLEASEYVRSFQERTGVPIGSIEHAALKGQQISHSKFSQLVHEMPESYYKSLLHGLL